MVGVYICLRKGRESAPLIRESVRLFAKELGIAEEIAKGNLAVDYDAYGKPYLPGGGAHVSVSHSGVYFCCAVSASPVGVDIEKIRDMPFQKIVRRFCSPDEYDYLMAGPGNNAGLGNSAETGNNTGANNSAGTGERPCAKRQGRIYGADMRRRFYNIWTLKESYVKFMGKGLRIPLDSFSVASGGRLCTELGEAGLISMEALPGYGMGLCLSKRAYGRVVILKE